MRNGFSGICFFGYYNNSSATVPGGISLVRSVWGRPLGYIIPRPCGSVPTACIILHSPGLSNHFCEFFYDCHLATTASRPSCVLTNAILASLHDTHIGTSLVLGSVPATLINPGIELWFAARLTYNTSQGPR